MLHIILISSLTSVLHAVKYIHIVKRIPIMLQSSQHQLLVHLGRCNVQGKTYLKEDLVPKRDKSKRLQVVITEEQDSLLTKTAYQLSNPERLVSKSEVVRLGIEMLNRAVEKGDLSPDLVRLLESQPKLGE
jgi:hypothetical protein